MVPGTRRPPGLPGRGNETVLHGSRGAATYPVWTRRWSSPPTSPASAPACDTLSPRAAEEGTGAPRTGRALFAWTKDQDGKFEYGLLKYLSVWAKSQEFPARMVDWDAAQVSRAYSEARRRLRALQATRQGAEAVLSK